MKRIAVVVPEYRTPQSPGGGVSAVADFVVSAFTQDASWEVSLISPRMWSGAPESRRIFAPRSWLRGPSVRTLPTPTVPVTYVGANWAEFEFLRYRPRRALTRLLDRHDLVLVVSGTPAVFGVAGGVGIPVLAQVATTAWVERELLVRSARGARRLLTRANRWLTSIADARSVGIPLQVAVENEWMAGWCHDNGARGVVLMPPGIDTTVFSPADVAKPGYVLTVGRLDDPRKDISTLFRSYADAVHRHGIRQSLVLAGRRPPPGDVVALLDELGIADRVRIRTDQSQEELVALYRGADLFVMSSSEEGLGIVMQEAMGCGIPVVTTATEGARTVVGDSAAGVLVEFGAELEHRLAAAVATMALDTEGRLQSGRAARSRAVELFSSETVGPRFVRAADDLIDAVGSARVTP